MAWYDFLVGTSGQTQQLPRFNPQQQDIFKQLQQMGLQGLQNPSQGFEPIKQQALSQFSQQIVPSLSERFTSMGGAGTAALSSPAFASQLGQAGAGLSENLAALQAQYGLQQQGHFRNLISMGLEPQFEQAYTPPSPGLIQGAAGQLGGGIGSLGNLGIRALLSLLGVV